VQPSQCGISPSTIKPISFHLQKVIIIIIVMAVRMLLTRRYLIDNAELCLSLAVHGKTYHLRASTAEEKLGWVSKINLLKYSRQHGGTAGLKTQGFFFCF
jgi:hypothetical protein